MTKASSRLSHGQFEEVTGIWLCNPIRLLAHDLQLGLDG